MRPKVWSNRERLCKLLELVQVELGRCFFHLHGCEQESSGIISMQQEALALLTVSEYLQCLCPEDCKITVHLNQSEKCIPQIKSSFSCYFLWDLDSLIYLPFAAWISPLTRWAGCLMFFSFISYYPRTFVLTTIRALLMVGPGLITVVALRMTWR